MSRIKIFSVLFAAVAAAGGSLLHFTYEWLGGKGWSFVSAVNESTWEHLKLLFWPVAALTALEYFVYGRKTENFLFIRLVSLLSGMIIIVAAFYTYSGVLGYNFLAADITVFLMGVAAVYVIGYMMMKNKNSGELSEADTSFLSVCSLAALMALAVLFMIFTYEPPSIGLFQDHVTGKYGI